MKRTLSRLLLSGLAVAICTFAQGGPNTNATRLGPVDMTKLTTVEGNIASLQIGFGTRTPSFTVASQVIRLAPVWYFLDHDFELTSGEAVKVMAAPATDNTLHAVSIVKTATGTQLALRGEDGLPLWIGPPASAGGQQQQQGQQAQNSPSPRTGAPCIDLASVATVTGVVEELTAGYGIQYPSLILAAGDTRLAIKLGPERVIQRSGIDFAEGVTLTIQYAKASCTDELVAMSVTAADGTKLVLRTADGLPAW